MRIIPRMLRQKAVYWEPKDKKDRYGEDKFHLPVEVKCRWEDVIEKDIDENQEEIIFKSTVYLDKDVIKGGYLRFGKLEELNGATEIPDDAVEIKRFERFPTLKARQFLRIARL